MYPNCLINSFETHFDTQPTLLVRAPGRINLIGEHTDYNGGYVMPAAIDKAVYFAVSAREDDICHFMAYDLNENFTVSLKNLVKTDTNAWANYLMGVLIELRKVKPFSHGINLVFGGDLPSGGGVSSSAAIENGIGFAVNEIFNLGLSRLDLVNISQQAENNFVGMKCGIMDMFASMMGKRNAVIRLDCRSLEFQYFPFNTPDMRLVLCDTTVKHALVDSEYNTRRAECEEGVSELQKLNPLVKTLRDVQPSFLRNHKSIFRPVVFKRCKYIVEEIARVEKACKALKKKDFNTFGQLMFQTHEGLQNEYEVSCAELDFLVKTARIQSDKGVLGARMMGGGFGGCTINLVKSDRVEGFIDKMKTAYQEAFGLDLPCHIVTPQNGVDIVLMPKLAEHMLSV